MISFEAVVVVLGSYTKVMMDSELNATMNRHPGLNELSESVDSLPDFSEAGREMFGDSSISFNSVHTWTCL